MNAIDQAIGLLEQRREIDMELAAIFARLGIEPPRGEVEVSRLDQPTRPRKPRALPAAAAASEAPPEKNIGGGEAEARGGKAGRRGLVLESDDFPGKTFTTREVQKLCGVSTGTGLTWYLKNAKPIGGKHVFRYAAATGQAPPRSDEGEAEEVLWECVRCFTQVRKAREPRKCERCGCREFRTGKPSAGAAGGGESDDEPAGAGGVNRELKPLEGAALALVEEYAALAAVVAEAVHRTLPQHVRLEDMISDGHLGLIDAAKKFNPARGVKFPTYAARRIRGTILDQLRERDPVPRLCRARQKRVDKARAAARNRLGREPARGEVIDELGLGEDAARRMLEDAAVKHEVSMFIGPRGSGRDDREQDVFQREDVAEPPDRDAARGEWFAWLCRGLTRTEYAIVCLYYIEELSMKEIGATLDLCESRISQLHGNILPRLRARLEGAGEVPIEFKPEKEKA